MAEFEGEIIQIEARAAPVNRPCNAPVESCDTTRCASVLHESTYLRACCMKPLANRYRRSQRTSFQEDASPTLAACQKGMPLTARTPKP